MPPATVKFAYKSRARESAAHSAVACGWRMRNEGRTAWRNNPIVVHRVIALHITTATVLERDRASAGTDIYRRVYLLTPKRTIRNLHL